jgi:hypothetical protein
VVWVALSWQRMNQWCSTVKGYNLSGSEQCYECLDQPSDEQLLKKNSASTELASSGCYALPLFN